MARATRRSGASGRAREPVLGLPPKTAEETAAERRLIEKMRALADDLRARHLATAVGLAQQATYGHGPLVDHFVELGRRYAHLLDPDKAPRPTLRVVVGGAS